MNWMNNVTSWTGLTTEGAIGAADEREVWRKTDYDGTEPVSRMIENRTGYHHDLLRHKAANKIQWNTTKAQV